MKKITKAAFGYGRPDGLNLRCSLACAEYGLCCATAYLFPQKLNGVQNNEAHH